MPNSLSIAQIQQLQTTLASGDINGVYSYLSQQGYNYAGWAGGVAAGNTIAGVAALDFMQGTALMGVGGPECQILSAETIQSIKSGMARSYLETLTKIADANNGYASRDINGEEVWKFHKDVFGKNGLSIDNWTLNAPFLIIQKLEGEQGLDSYWSYMRGTKGADSYDAIVANLGTLAFMHKQTTSSDPEIRAMANAWMQNVPGIYDWNQIEKTLSTAATAWGAKLAGFPNLGGNYHAMGNFIAYLQDVFHTAEVTRSPLILDLNGNGVETINQTAAIHFDHDGNRFAETTGWVGKGDGLLVLDRNGNGQIDDGGELFGNNTNLEAGGKAANGFAALADLDGNHDGKIDAGDAVFKQLRVWKDGDSNAVASSGELLTLAEAGVSSIATGFVAQTVTDAQGNQHLQGGNTRAPMAARVPSRMSGSPPIPRAPSIKTSSRSMLPSGHCLNCRASAMSWPASGHGTRRQRKAAIAGNELCQ